MAVGGVRDGGLVQGICVLFHVHVGQGGGGCQWLEGRKERVLEIGMGAWARAGRKSKKGKRGEALWGENCVGGRVVKEGGVTCPEFSFPFPQVKKCLKLRHDTPQPKRKGSSSVGTVHQHAHTHTHAHTHACSFFFLSPQPKNERGAARYTTTHTHTHACSFFFPFPPSSHPSSFSSSFVKRPTHVRMHHLNLPRMPPHQPKDIHVQKAQIKEEEEANVREDTQVMHAGEQL